MMRETGSPARVSAPRQSLESYFLSVVADAEREGAATSGARGSRDLAAFLGSEPSALERPDPDAE